MGAVPKPLPDVCQGCGKLFPRLNVRLCASCSLDPQRRFSLVRDLLAESPGMSIGDIVAATGLSRGEVSTYYEERRLVEVTPELPVGALRTCTCGGQEPRCVKCTYELSARLRDMRKDFEGRLPPKGQWAGGASEDDRVRYIRRAQRIDPENP